MEPVRSGTEKRKKTTTIGVRVTDVERAEIEAKAERENFVSAPAFLRFLALDKVETKGRKRPSLDRVLLGKVLGDLGKSGNNLNQIARRLNEGGNVTAERLFSAIEKQQLVLDEVLKALNVFKE